MPVESRTNARTRDYVIFGDVHCRAGYSRSLVKCQSDELTRGNSWNESSDEKSLIALDPLMGDFGSQTVPEAAVSSLRLLSLSLAR
jgi:hypothetical protein